MAVGVGLPQGTTVAGVGSCARRTWADADVIDVLFVLTSRRIKVKRSRIRHVTASQVGYDGDVIPYLILVRPAFLRIERVAHCYIGRPGNTGIRAIRIKQLGKQIACIVASVVPNRVEPTIGRTRQMCRTNAICFDG